MKTNTAVADSKMFVHDDEVNVTGIVEYHVEVDYASDADGYRGERRIIVDNVGSVVAYNLDGGDIALTPEQEDEAKETLENSFLESGE